MYSDPHVEKQAIKMENNLPIYLEGLEKEEKNKFLERYNLLRLNQEEKEEIENMKRSITCVESVI